MAMQVVGQPARDLARHFVQRFVDYTIPTTMIYHFMQMELSSTD